MNRHSDDPRLPWGKYRGRRLSELPASYLLWLLEEARLPAEMRATVQRVAGQKARVLGVVSTLFNGSSRSVDTHGIIDRCFRRLALKHHPDRGGSTAAMAALNEMLAEVRKALGS